MRRFPCDSLITSKFYLSLRTAILYFRHLYHDTYLFENDISLDVSQFISERAMDCTPAELSRALQRNNVPGWESTKQNQVYYRWQRANMGAWRRGNSVNSNGR